MDQSLGQCYSSLWSLEEDSGECYRQREWLGNECFAHENMICVCVREVNRDGAAIQVHNLDNVKFTDQI